MARVGHSQKSQLEVAGLRGRILWLSGEHVIEVTSVSASGNTFFWFRHIKIR